MSSKFNRLSKNDEIRGMQVAKDLQCIDAMLPFICGHVQKANGCNQDVKLTKASTMYFELLSEMYSRNERV